LRATESDDVGSTAAADTAITVAMKVTTKILNDIMIVKLFDFRFGARWLASASMFLCKMGNSRLDRLFNIDSEARQEQDKVSRSSLE
jgi:hypothetical protein